MANSDSTFEWLHGCLEIRSSRVAFYTHQGNDNSESLYVTGNVMFSICWKSRELTSSTVDIKHTSMRAGNLWTTQRFD